MSISRQITEAIWKSHGERCIYHNGPLGWEGLQIDHIIPQVLWDNPSRQDERVRLLAELSLPVDFKKDGPLNLIPSCQRCNRQKSDDYHLPQLHHLLRLSRRKQPEVMRRIKALEKEAQQGRWVSKVAAMAETAPEHRQALLNTLDQSRPFSPCRRWDEKTFEFTSMRIRMTGDTPSLPRSEFAEPSLLIEFNTLFLHRLRLRLTDEQVITDLFDSRGTDWRIGQRRFVTRLPDGEHPDAIATLAGMEITLTPEELDQWCALIDDLAPHYLEALMKEEEIRGTLSFPLTGKRGGVVLCAVPRPLWQKIQEFAHTHDFSNGNTKWHIFDATGSFYLRVGARGRTRSGYDRELTCVQPVRGTHLQDSVELAWISECGLDKSSEWGAQKTHDWLMEKLIPEVIGPKGKILTALGLNQDDVRSHLRYGGDFKELKPGVENLERWTLAVQEHFNATQHDGVPKSLLHSAYDGLEHLVRLTHTESLRHDYLAGKLGASEKHTGLLEWIQAARRRDQAKDKVRGWDFDLIFRCAWVLMKDHPPEESPALGKLVEFWKPLHEHYRLDWLRLRHSRKPEYE